MQGTTANVAVSLLMLQLTVSCWAQNAGKQPTSGSVINRKCDPSKKPSCPSKLPALVLVTSRQVLSLKADPRLPHDTRSIALW